MDLGAGTTTAVAVSAQKLLCERIGARAGGALEPSHIDFGVGTPTAVDV
jgi:hypothetical protein